MMNSVMNQGLYGMQRSQNAMSISATQIANGGQSSPAGGLQAVAQGPKPNDLTSALVDMKQQQHFFDASAKVVAAANHTLGSLLDATA